MKKKLFITLILVLTLTVTALCFVSCQEEEAKPDFNRYLELASASYAQAVNTTTNISLTDGDVVVYSSVKTIAVNGDQASVTVTETMLGEYGAMENDTETKQIAKADVKAPFALAAEDVLYNSLTENGFTCIVFADKVAKVVCFDGVTADGDATVTCVFDGEKLVSFTCETVLSSGKQLVVSITLAY